MINDIMYRYIDAIEFATLAHAGQTRKFGTREPYVAHPIRVSKLILHATEVIPLERRMKLATAAVLHDVIEDTSIKSAAMTASFGRDVTMLVESVTKNMALPKADKEIEFLLRFKQADVDTVLLKLADRLDNLNSMVSAPLDFKRKYIANTKQLLKALPTKAQNDRQVISLWETVQKTMQGYEDEL